MDTRLTPNARENLSMNWVLGRKRWCGHNEKGVVLSQRLCLCPRFAPGILTFGLVSMSCRLKTVFRHKT